MVSLDSLTQTGLDNATAKDSFLNSKNPDLMAFKLIFSHLQVSDDKKSRQCLLNLALTCKDFLEEALDALWGKLNSLVPLLKLLPTLQVENDSYVLTGNVSQADWDRLQYYSRKVKSFKAPYPYVDRDETQPKVHPSTYLQIAQLPSQSPSQSSALFPSLRRLAYYLDDRTISHFFLFSSPLLDSLQLFNKSPRGRYNVDRIAVNYDPMLVDIFKNYTGHFKQLRSLELGLSSAVFMSDFGLLEHLGTLPSLEHFILMDMDSASHPAHAPENSNSQRGGLKYFEALESLNVMGSFFLIQHLLGFIDSPCLKSICLCPTVHVDSSYLKSIAVSPVVDGVRNEGDHVLKDILTPSMTIISSKWSQSLKDLTLLSSPVINDIMISLSNSKILTLLTNLREMQSFQVWGWTMDNIDDAVRRLAMSWPKLRTLLLLFNRTFISLSTLRIIAENFPHLNHLHVQLDTLTIPSFDDISSKRVRHNLEVLHVLKFGDLGGHPSDTSFVTQTPPELERQIQVARHLDLIFPNLKTLNVSDENWLGISDLVKLCQVARRSL